MKERLRKALSVQCKDMGLDSKSIDELAETTIAVMESLGKGLNDESTDEEVEQAAKTFSKFGKGSQAFMTRKMAEKKPSKKQSDEDGSDEGVRTHTESGKDNELAKILERISNLENENKSLKERQEKATKKESLKAALKKHGISEFLTDYIRIDDVEDVEGYVTKLKQDYINAQLPLQDKALEQGGSGLEQRRKDAEAWVKNNYKVD